MPNVPVSVEAVEGRVQTEGDAEPEKETSEKKKDASDSANEAIFYKTGEFWMIEKALEKNEQTEKGLDKIINFTKEMLDLVPLETLRKDFGEHIDNYKAEWEKRDAKEKERRQQVETEKAKKEELRKKELEEQRKQALETFEKRVKDNLKKQQMDMERRQKEIEGLKLKEMETRKKNIEHLMNKKAEREKKRFRTRVLKIEPKKNDMYFDESKEIKDESKRLKVDEARTSKTLVEVQSAGLKSNTTSGNGLVEPHSATELHGPAVQKDTETAEQHTEQAEKPLEQLRSDSHRQSLQHVNTQYFMSPPAESPKGSKTIHNLTTANMKAETKFKQVLNESLAITKGRGRERLTDSFKLPKIQKTGRVIVDELNSLKAKTKKDNKENLREKV